MKYLQSRAGRKAAVEARGGLRNRTSNVWRHSKYMPWLKETKNAGPVANFLRKVILASIRRANFRGKWDTQDIGAQREAGGCGLSNGIYVHVLVGGNLYFEIIWTILRDASCRRHRSLFESHPCRLPSVAWQRSPNAGRIEGYD
jgi:hypothetical protein